MKKEKKNKKKKTRDSPLRGDVGNSPGVRQKSHIG